MKAIKDIPSAKDGNFATRAREELMRFMGRTGDPLDAAVTFRTLKASGFELGPGFAGGGGGKPITGVPGTGNGGETQKDLTPPPTPTGFDLDSGITSVFVMCDRPLYLQGHGHGASLLYGIPVVPGDPLPTFTDALPLAQFQGTVYSFATNPAVTWRMWLKWQTVDGVESIDPAGGINGLEIRTGEDVQALLDALNGKITEDQLYTDLGERINLIDGNGPNSVNQRLLMVARAPGSGANLVDNSEFASSLVGWQFAPYAANVTFGRNLADEWVVGRGVAFIQEIGTAGGLSYVYPFPFFPVIANKKYQSAIETGAHRCEVLFEIQWVNAAGVAFDGSGYGVNDAEKAGGRTLSGYKRLTSMGVAPDGAVAARLVLVKQPTKPGETDSYAFFTRAFFSEAKDDQTEVDPYSTGPSVAALESKMEVRADENGLLKGGYQFKVDLNGYVTGFGLAATGGSGATPSSLFLIRAGTFAIASPTGPGIAPIIPFSVSTVAETINGVYVPVGVYMEGAYIKNGTIINAKIANLSVDNAKIANVNVSKLTAGSLLVGSFIESANYIAGTQGYRINGAGNVEFQNGLFRGTIHADAGYFSGELRAAVGSFAGDLSAARGIFRGGILGGAFYDGNWQNGDGFYLDQNVFRMGNLYANRYIEIGANGNIYAPSFSIVNGVARFSGELNAASGTFSGALNAASGTFSGVFTADAINAVQGINIAGGAVATSTWAQGNGSVSLGISVPAGQVHRVMLLGYFPGGSIASAGVAAMTGLGNTPVTYVHYLDPESGNPVLTRTPMTLISLIDLGGGNHTLSAFFSDGQNGVISLAASIIRRP